MSNTIFMRRRQRDYACRMPGPFDRALTWMFAAAVVASLSAAGAARAADWPSNPIRVIVPYSAGSAADIVPRIVFDKVKEQLGQTIIIENKPGASGTIGARAAAQATCLLYTSPSPRDRQKSRMPSSA